MAAYRTHGWPDAIHDVTTRLLGRVASVEALGGMSGSAVVRVHGECGSAILKRSTCSAETHVYTVAAAAMRDAGIRLPNLYLAQQDAGTYWLLLEDIPLPLPPERWLADADVIDTLRRLHAIVPLDIVPPDRYVPTWTAEMTGQALSLIPPAVATDTRAQLDAIRERCQLLFTPACVISGDPNPANWGLRNDGSLVLYDWERLTLGTPAIDLAITVPGLGTRNEYATVAASYANGVDVPVLPQDVADAKVWTVIELLAGCARGDVSPSFPLEVLIPRLPSWLRELAIAGER